MVVAGTFEKLVEQLACEEKPGKASCVICVDTYQYVRNFVQTVTVLLCNSFSTT